MAETKRITELKKELFDSYFAGLNDAQLEAVRTVDGPVLVLAGAGSGKTTVLVNRIAGIIKFGNLYYGECDGDEKAMKSALDSGDRQKIGECLESIAVSPAKPWNVLCITFTNKAADEFKERLSSLLGSAASDIWAGTFHSICVRILRRHIDRLGYKRDFTIYDSDDSKKLVTDIMKRLEINDRNLTPKGCLNIISRAKEKGQSFEDYEKEIGSDVREGLVARVYRAYQTSLQKANALDFDDIIMLTNILFETEKDVLSKYKEQFEYILVDEYQDTNPAQNQLVITLAKGNENVCVVGDDDQSIYSFRGATVDNILHFDKVFRNTKTIRLEQNYRSSGNILAAANGLISHNTERKGKELWTSAENGEPVLIKKQYTQSEEATYIVSQIRAQVATGETKYGDYAILYRMNAQSNALEIIMSKNRIPYRVFGGMRFYDHKEIKDIVAYLAVINNQSDDTRLKRIINTPKRQIGLGTIAIIEEIAQGELRPMYEIVVTAAKYPALAKAEAKLSKFAELIEGLKAFASENSVADTVREVIERTEYIKMLENDDEKTKIELVNEFISSAVSFEETAEEPTLSTFLEDIALVSDIDNYNKSADAVTLMTIHSAKGLEFPIVYIPGFEDGIFPSNQSISEGQSAIEEERRLAYVAITRARKRVVILYTSARLMFGKTSNNPVSRFAEEIPGDFKLEEAKPQNPSATVSESKKRYVHSQEMFKKNVSSSGIHADFEKKEEVAVFCANTRIVHNIFGAGVITSAEDMGGDMLYTIDFDSGSQKRLMGTFAKLKPEEE